MLYLEANNGTWGISLDGLYMDLEQTAGILPIAAGVSQGAVEERNPSGRSILS